MANDPILQMATDAGLSAESVRLCRMGAFDVPDLVDHLPALRPLIAQHGERTVVERCQIARLNCGSAEQAIDCVLAYYRAPNDAARVASEQWRRALSPAERSAALVAIGRNPDGSRAS